MDDKLNDFVTNSRAVEPSTITTPPPSTGFETFTWGGKMGRYTPPDFIFPVETARTMWELWHYGHAELRIRPYKCLRDPRHTDEVSRDGKRCTNFSKAAKIMNALGEICVREKFVNAVENITNLGYEKGREIFDKAYPILLQDLFQDKIPTRSFEMKYTTLYNAYSKTNSQE
jgi:hypothetical protein